MLRPLGDRVIIRPRANPTKSASGLLHLSEHRKPEMIGTVMAVGPCGHPLRPEAEKLSELLTSRWFGDDESHEWVKEAAHMLLVLAEPKPEVKVGELVTFSWQVGQEVWLDDERYLLMRQRDILAVIEGTPCLNR